MQLLNDLKERNERKLGIKRGSTISRSVENSIWKRLWTYRKTDYGMNEKKRTKSHKPIAEK
jgi:hypothetical protein